MEATTAVFQERIRRAASTGEALSIVGSGSKGFYGGLAVGEALEIGTWRGVVDYEPGELVLVARSGTPLLELEALLAGERQMLAFEPPRFGGGGTLGGCVAAGLSGPRRPYCGAVRDFVLGVRVLDGRGEDLSFGGRVIKNVAGYDVSRLMVGAMGTLGLLLEVSLKVLPQPVAELSLRQEMDQASAIAALNRWAGRPLPVTGSCYHDGQLTVRIAGAEQAVARARKVLGGEPVADAHRFWASLRDQTADYFSQAASLWRAAVPQACPPLLSALPQLIEWGGAVRWFAGTAGIEALGAEVARLGGSLISFRGQNPTAAPYPPPTAAIAGLQARLKAAFDPHGILNRGRAWYG